MKGLSEGFNVRVYSYESRQPAETIGNNNDFGCSKLNTFAYQNNHIA
jgi:hypothetical protein